MSKDKTDLSRTPRRTRAMTLALMLCLVLLTFMASGPVVQARAITGAEGAVEPPVVAKFTIDTKDFLTSQETILRTTLAEGSEATLMYVREWQIVQQPNPHWDVAASSGWVPFAEELPWTLSAQSGLHFVGVWVANAEHVTSLMTFKSLDFASLQLKDTPVGKDEVIPYLIYYETGVDVKVTLTPTSGNPDLYVWYPYNYEDADQTSSHPGLELEELTFTTTQAGIYVFMAHGIEASVYDLVISPEGGPNFILPGWGEPTRAAAFDQMPIFTEIGTDPITAGLAETPPLLWRKMFLSIVRN